MCCLPRQTLDPYERVHTSCPEEFVTTETYKDIICSCDGLVLYLEMMRKKFPDAVITTYFLGSDQNEQLYAFIRVSYSHGRSRNLDAITIAYGIERRNVWSELSITNFNSVIAHTRGRSVLRPELKITGENEVDELRITPPGAWKGSDIKLETLVQTMNKATTECIREGKERNLGVFVVKEDPDIRTGKKIALGSYRTLLQDDESSGEEDSEVEEEPVHLEFEDDSGPASIETKNYGTINFRAAETLLLNGGGSSISTKSRKSQFTGDVFGIEPDIRLYRQNFCGCETAVERGDKMTLPTFANKNKVAKGEVRFLSYNNSLMQFYCKSHSVINGVPNIWLHVKQRDTYVRCIFI